MKTVAIIGLGRISKHYINGLQASNKLKVIAVCDQDASKNDRELFGKIPFFVDYQSMLNSKFKPDYVIVATPPKAHFPIAKWCLQNGTSVIIEKPVTLNILDLQKLFSLAKENNLDFQVMYHWQNGEEIPFLKERCFVSPIKKISVCVLDPYSDDGVTINEDKLGLEGAWIDSGVNSLSYAKTFLPFESVLLKSVQIKRCEKSNLPIYANCTLLIDQTEVEIKVDWTKGVNSKTSEILLENGEKIVVSHSNQTVTIGEEVFNFNKMERLATHYYNYFVFNFNERKIDKQTEKIHSVLFMVRDHYEKTNS